MTEHATEHATNHPDEAPAPATGHGGDGGEGHREHPNYLAVWGGLALLTLLEVGVAFVGLSRAVIVVTLLALAVWKALLVALYFMHLRFESAKLVMIAVAPLPLAGILMLVVLQEF